MKFSWYRLNIYKVGILTGAISIYNGINMDKEENWIWMRILDKKF